MTKQKENTDLEREIQIEIAFASITDQRIVPLVVPSNTTARKAIEISELQMEYPEFNFQSATIGVFGKIVPDNYILTDSDRVEVYRPLYQSPVDARRKRVQKPKTNRR